MATYNPKKAVNEIAWLKGAYANSETDEDRNWAANEANRYYDELHSYGRSDIANSLQGMDAGAAKTYKDTIYKQYDTDMTNKTNNIVGKTSTRDAVKNLGYDVSDKDIKYDDQTGVISVKGYNFKPDYLDNDAGISYLSNESISKLNDYLGSNTGINRGYNSLENEANKLSLDYLKDKNDFTLKGALGTEEGQKLLDMYQTKGDNYGKGYLATGGGQ